MRVLSLFILAVLSILSVPAWAAVQIGDVVPNMAVTDYMGKSHNLHDFAGKVVVLEWVNYGCPFVRKHYDSGNMQALQKSATIDGIVWLSVMSSAPGKQGYYTTETAPAAIKENNFQGTNVILDPSGALGRAFDATATPNMYIITPDSKLVYAGAIDSIPSFRQKDIPNAINYVQLALEELKQGQFLSIPQTVPYGCSIKY